MRAASRRQAAGVSTLFAFAHFRLGLRAIHQRKVHARGPAPVRSLSHADAGALKRSGSRKKMERVSGLSPALPMHVFLLSAYRPETRQESSTEPGCGCPGPSCRESRMTPRAKQRGRTVARLSQKSNLVRIRSAVMQGLAGQRRFLQKNNFHITFFRSIGIPEAQMEAANKKSTSMFVTVKKEMV